jgi:hypothetical protein
MRAHACAHASPSTCLTPQRSDMEQFLFDTTVEATVKDTVAALSRVNNLRQRLMRLKLEGEELSKYGAAKLPDKQGIDEYQEDTVDKGAHYMQDPTGRRTGNGEHPWRTACVLTSPRMAISHAWSCGSLWLQRRASLLAEHACVSQPVCAWRSLASRAVCVCVCVRARMRHITRHRI